MMKGIKSILFVVLLLAFVLPVGANNVRLVKEVSIDPASILDGIAEIKFEVAWDNSWRDDFNWDAVYLFFKYKKKGESAWKHVYLMDGGHSIGASGFEYKMAKTGTAVNQNMGLFVQRSKSGRGNVSLPLTLRWLISTNGLSEVDFMNGDVECQGMCIEMVYVPVGAFRIGDGVSEKTFQRNYRPILEEWDCLDSRSGEMEFWASGNANSEDYKKYPPSNAANRINSTDPNNAWVSTASSGECMWQVDFKDKPRAIRYFGLSGLKGYTAPATWELRAKNDNTDWITLWTGKNDAWYLGANTYPIQQALQVDPSKVKPYRYYQIHVITATSKIGISNIAMTEVDMAQMTNDAFIVDKASGVVLDMATNLSAADGDTWNGTLQANYPTGFNSFYAMKYEVSQEQWVRFLNKLEYNQQKQRTVGDRLDALITGQYVYGNGDYASCRNGIAIGSRDQGAVVFVNNLNKSNDYAQKDDGQTLACNFLSPADMLAYADWTGLRPLSEMEYEKMARDPYPALPIQKGWAAGESSDLVKPGSSSLSNARTADERYPLNGGKSVNVNAGSVVGGPVRVGASAATARGRLEAGAGFWGHLDLSGNLAEIYYACNNGYGRNFQDIQASHGDGNLVANSTVATAGNTDISKSYWPQEAAAFMIRGGHFNSADIRLAVSDRSGLGYFSDMNVKDSLVTFRLGHSVSKLNPVEQPKTFLTLVSGAVSTADGKAVDSVCSQTSYLIRGTDVRTLPGGTGGRYSYIWYKSDNSGSTWDVIEGEEGCDLTYDKFYNESGTLTTVWFKRRTVTNDWTDETKYVVIKVISTGYAFNRLKDTITMANHSLGYWVDTKTPARFVWKWKSTTGDVMLHSPTNGQLTYDYYAPLRRQYNSRTGDQTLICEMSFMGRCIKKQELDLYIEPRPTVGVPSTAITINAADPKNECGVMMQDNRSGVQLYKTIRIGDQCWMAENLRYPMGAAYCKFSQYDPTGEITGAFYVWHATVHSSACPAGWRIPTYADWNKLNETVSSLYGGNTGIHLKQGAYWYFTASTKATLGDNRTGFGMPGTGYFNGNSFGAYSGTDGMGNYYMSYAYAVDINNYFSYYGYAAAAMTTGHGYWSWYWMPIRCIKN